MLAAMKSRGLSNIRRIQVHKYSFFVVGMRLDPSFSHTKRRQMKVGPQINLTFTIARVHYSLDDSSYTCNEAGLVKFVAVIAYYIELRLTQCSVAAVAAKTLNPILLRDQ